MILTCPDSTLRRPRRKVVQHRPLLDDLAGRLVLEHVSNCPLNPLQVGIALRLEIARDLRHAQRELALLTALAVVDQRPDLPQQRRIVSGGVCGQRGALRGTVRRFACRPAAPFRARRDRRATAPRSPAPIGAAAPAGSASADGAGGRRPSSTDRQPSVVHADLEVGDAGRDAEHEHGRGDLRPRGNPRQRRPRCAPGGRRHRLERQHPRRSGRRPLRQIDPHAAQLVQLGAADRAPFEVHSKRLTVIRLEIVVQIRDQDLVASLIACRQCRS